MTHEQMDGAAAVLLVGSVVCMPWGWWRAAIVLSLGGILCVALGVACIRRGK